MPLIAKSLILFLAGGIAGVINSVAGGGTLFTFPTLLFAGVPAIHANATSTVALLLGTGASVWGYRRELVTQKTWAWRFAAPSLLGGLLGAVLLRHTGEVHFRAIVPYLILFAAALFTFQGPITRRLQIESRAIGRSRSGVAGAIIFQFLAAIYGGYFGAGLGIVMLATLRALGQEDIHEMNSLKVLLGFLINVVAAVYFIVSGLILWTEAIVMAVGAGLGGAVGPYLARRVGAKVVRGFVSVVGFAIGIYFLVQ